VIRQHKDMVSSDLQKEIRALITEDKKLLKKLAKVKDVFIRSRI
jgi:hypothetical protein